jgi:hypothetical protein
VLRRKVSLQLIAAAEDWMTKQPDGYNNFREWLPPSFYRGLRVAAQNMQTPELRTRDCARLLGTDRAAPLQFLFLRVLPRLSPVRIVLDADAPWLKVGKPFPKQFGLQVFVFSRDHKPPHIHIECPPGNPLTRYLWPDLVPYPKDPRLGSSEEKALHEYVGIHGLAIARKVAAVPWQ